MAVVIECSFAPDPVRAAAIDRRMHAELGRSLRHIVDSSRGIVDFDADAVRSLADRLIATETARPTTFARYFELVDALRDDRLAAAAVLFAELTRAPSSQDMFEIAALGSPELGDDSTRFLAMMNADADLDIGFQAPTADVEQAFRGRLSSGLALLDRAVPALAGEIRRIIRQIVICGSDPTKKMQFDGGSHYQLWGALFLNGNYHMDAIAVAEVLAHESAHSLLFGFMVDEPLVENDDDELFVSPLRSDPRPMDGIYHATFVSARMHWAMSRLAESDVLTADEQARARTAADIDHRNFKSGLSVIEEHGRLSGTGAKLMTAACEYMAQA